MMIFSAKTVVVAGIVAVAAATLALSACPVSAMNKQELIAAMAKDAGISRVDAQKAVEAFILNTAKALKHGERVALVGFGSFSVSKRAARTGRNLQTGKEIKIAARKVVKFKPGKVLEDQANN